MSEETNTTTETVKFPEGNMIACYNPLNLIPDKGYNATIVGGGVRPVRGFTKLVLETVLEENGKSNYHEMPFDAQYRKTTATALTEAFGIEFTTDPTDYTPDKVKQLFGKKCELKTKEENWIDKTTGQPRSAVRTRYLNKYRENLGVSDLETMKAKEAQEKVAPVAF
jgi:hypothetical protein